MLAAIIVISLIIFPALVPLEAPRCEDSCTDVHTHTSMHKVSGLRNAHM